MQLHELKTVQPFYRRVADGAKIWEVRLNDRNYQKRDLLWLREWNGVAYTGAEVIVMVNAIWDNETLPGAPLKEGHVILDISRVLTECLPGSLKAVGWKKVCPPCPEREAGTCYCREAVELSGQFSAGALLGSAEMNAQVYQAGEGKSHVDTAHVGGKRI